MWGYELWLAFLVAATATGGSLFYSEIAGFVPCELCWYQRICMYPLSILTLLPALAATTGSRATCCRCRSSEPASPSTRCSSSTASSRSRRNASISAPGGCATKWIDEFGYLTIPILTLTAFALVFAFLLLRAASNVDRGGPEA